MEEIPFITAMLLGTTTKERNANRNAKSQRSMSGITAGLIFFSILDSSLRSVSQDVREKDHQGPASVYLGRDLWNPFIFGMLFVMLSFSMLFGSEACQLERDSMQGTTHRSLWSLPSFGFLCFSLCIFQAETRDHVYYVSILFLFPEMQNVK